MRTAQNTVQMNHLKHPLPSLKVGFDHPHPSLIIRTISDCLKPMDKRAWICDALMFERKEEKNASNKQTFETWGI
jgi:hypothetical protein